MDIFSGWEGEGARDILIVRSLGNSPSETPAKDDVANPHQRPGPRELWLTTEAAPVSEKEEPRPLWPWLQSVGG